MKGMTPRWLATEVATVMADVLIHQRPRWGTLLAHRNQLEGWWKAEFALALESWTWRGDLQERPFGVQLEAKPRDWGLADGKHAVDLLVAPWSMETGRLEPEATPRAWIELKTRGTWWGNAAKAFGTANKGLRSDIQKWGEIDKEGEVFLACQVTSHDGPWEEMLHGDWKQELDDIAAHHERIIERTVGFELSGEGKASVRWTRFDCFMVCEPAPRD